MDFQNVTPLGLLRILDSSSKVSDPPLLAPAVIQRADLVLRKCTACDLAIPFVLQADTVMYG